MSRPDINNVPKHVAIIMDGNGRWAKARGEKRVLGHKQGMETVKAITKQASSMGVAVLTLYAFSTENWKRPVSEVNYLMNLPVVFFDEFVPDLIKNNVKVETMGNVAGLPKKTQRAIADAKADTKNCTGMVLNFALNYGSRAEIKNAVVAIAKEVEDGGLSAKKITEETISSHLETAGLGERRDPDLLIRTSGEERISNFLLWQLAYSELMFVDKFWPDFTPDDFSCAIYKYQQRHRRFGGLDAK